VVKRAVLPESTKLLIAMSVEEVSKDSTIRPTPTEETACVPSNPAIVEPTIWAVSPAEKECPEAAKVKTVSVPEE
jgi:hypothetical protein